MPSINKSFLEKLHVNFTRYPVFVETGTFQGETTFACEPYFEKVYTIEIDKYSFDRVSSRYSGSKIEFLLGDSSDVFPTILPKIKDPTIFFLDGHWSGGSTGKGRKDCPLLEEVSLINSLFSEEAIIIIDDYRLFGKSPRLQTGNEDWEDISKEKIVSLISSRIENIYYVYVIDDRLILHISKYPKI